MSAVEISGLVPRLATARVVCVGDVMLDRFVYGDVDRISPEAPIPVLRVTGEAAMLGGAGNVVRNLVALGAGVDFVSVVGDDEIAGQVARLLSELDGVAPHMLTEKGRPTTTKVRYVAGGQQLLRADHESIGEISARVRAAIASGAVSAMTRAGAAILSDYGKGAISDEVARAVIDGARKAGIPAIVDPKSRDFRRYAGASLVTPNLKELGAAAGGVAATDDDIVAAARRVLAEAGIDAMLVTRGPQGMTLVTAGDAQHLASRAREVFDVSGAGDTVVAAIAAGVGAGLSTVEAAQIANVAAGVVVGKTGTAVAYPDDVLAALRENELAVGGDKAMALGAARDRIDGWRARGETVGFTNGCFDLLHPGHVALLRAARAECDRLVVGLNSDASVKRLKGESRPMQNEAARAVVLGSLETVDLVVIFEEDTPEALLREIRPDVLVKGADYTIAQVVGADFVQSYGGRVVLADLVPGFSTTATIEKMNAS